MSYEKVACQNGRVWARRLGLEINEGDLIDALHKTALYGSVLKGPLALLFFKKISQQSWASGLSGEDRQKLAIIAGFSVADIVRGDSNNVLSALAESAEERLWHVVFSKYCPELLDLVNQALHARAKEKARPSVANAIINKLHNP